ncbi:hypothetical protein OAT84_00855 [Gammaproteobacteria bacterium]|nr:hypothetical protein [Gammaproteobacteria bacterium]
MAGKSLARILLSFQKRIVKNLSEEQQRNFFTKSNKTGYFSTREIKNYIIRPAYQKPLQERLEQYFEYVNEDVQRDYADSLPETYLNYASEKLQKQLCEYKPETYLQHASEDVQQELCQADPEKYVQHASDKVKRMRLLSRTQDMFSNRKSKGKNNQSVLNNLNVADQNKFFYSEPSEGNRRYFKEKGNNISSAYQERLEERLEQYFQYASEDLQKAYAAMDSVTYLQHASEEVQAGLCIDTPMEFLKHASEEVKPIVLKQFEEDRQEELCTASPKELLKHAREEVQQKLCQNDPENYLKHASSKVQEDLCQTDPENYLKHASEEVKLIVLKKLEEARQEELCTASPEALLKHASEEVQQELCKENPKTFLKYASMHVQKDLYQKDGFKKEDLSPELQQEIKEKMGEIIINPNKPSLLEGGNSSACNTVLRNVKKSTSLGSSQIGNNTIEGLPGQSTKL